MTWLARTVDMHKRSLHKLISMSEVELIVELPVPRITTGVNPFFGDTTRESNETGERIGPFNCLWYDAYTAKSMGKSESTGIETIVESAAGQFRDATAFAEVWLQDVLLDQNNPAGQTWFDKALLVLSQGKKYNLLGYVKLGLSVSTPYSAVVGLKGMLGYDNS